MDRSPAISVPRLQTERLLLREHRTQDFDAFAAHLADAEATAYIGSADRATAWRIFGCQVGLWALQGAGWWIVEQRETGRAVGTVGAFFREGFEGIELGWNIYREFWGRGFASEAAAEAMRYAFEVRGEPHVRAFIDTANGRSLGVARRLGLRYDGEAELFGKMVARYTGEPER